MRVRPTEEVVTERVAVVLGEVAVAVEGMVVALEEVVVERVNFLN